MEAFDNNRGEADIPVCLGPLTHRSPVAFDLPKGAWDSHFHLLNPDRAPYAANRKYSPPPARIEDYLTLLDDLGLERGMLVHANLQGRDNQPLLEAIDQSDGRFVGVISMPAQTDAASLRDMNARGIRGIRFAFNPQHGGVFDLTRFHQAEAWCAEFGWFIELHFDPRDLPGLMPVLSQSGVPIVIDHMGRIDVTEGTDGAMYRLLAELAAQAHVWIKLSGADRISGKRSFADVVPIARDLIRIAPERMLWGSDWPHTGFFEGMPDDGVLLNLLHDYAPDTEIRNRILADNPLRLIGG